MSAGKASNWLGPRPVGGPQGLTKVKLCTALAVCKACNKNKDDQLRKRKTSYNSGSEKGRRGEKSKIV
ncbi:hypothetical protein EXN66_Car014155 [Channa argus]|uniref:Uncharacterized protein n=1 Tax=Channa argus TaxID=215402 RepID=A0A6G1Q7T4_CHAAH|nr:hypothetical protein EXN66_Car014155 [Channa argus]